MNQLCRSRQVEMRRHGLTHTLVVTIGEAILSGDEVTVGDHGVTIARGAGRLQIATSSRGHANALYERGLAAANAARR